MAYIFQHPMFNIASNTFVIIIKRITALHKNGIGRESWQKENNGSCRDDYMRDSPTSGSSSAI